MGRNDRRWAPADEIESLESLLAHCRNVEKWQTEQAAKFRARIDSGAGNPNAVKSWKKQATAYAGAIKKWRAWADALERLIGEITEHDQATGRLLESLDGEIT